MASIAGRAAAIERVLPSPIPGVHAGTDPGSVGRFEAWLGCDVPQALVFTDPFGWKGIADPGWFVDRFATLGRPILWSVPLLPKGAKLTSASNGQHDDDYRSAARILRRALPDAQGVIRIRIGWEFNGDWFPWAAAGNEREFIATFRRFVDACRSVDDRFRFEWNMNYGQSMDPAKAFPGSDYVDVIGMDFYWMPRYVGTDPVVAFERIRDDRHGLVYLDRLAATHRKPIAFSEWGVTGDRAAPFIERVKAWIGERDVAYHNYWNSNADYPGELSDNRWPRSAAAFREAFCANADVNAGTRAGQGRRVGR